MQANSIVCKCLFEALLSIRSMNEEIRGVYCLMAVFAVRIIKLIACTPMSISSSMLNLVPLSYSILTSVFLRSVNCFFVTQI